MNIKSMEVYGIRVEKNVRNIEIYVILIIRNIDTTLYVLSI